MAYEAHREPSGDEELEKEQKKAEADAANQKAVQVGAEVASNAGHPVVAAIGKGVKTADQASGGKVSELGGKALTKANKIAPFAQGITNKLANSEAGDAAYKAYNIKNKKGAAAGEAAKEGAEKAKEGAEQLKDAQGKKDLPNQVKKDNEGGEKKDSLPSSDDKNKQQTEQAKSKDSDSDTKEAPEDKKSKSDTDGEASGNISFSTKIVAISILPILLFVLIIVVVLTSVVGVFSDFDDAIGISSMQGDETGGIVFNASTKEQKDFFDRIIEVKNDFQMNGKSFDPLNIVAVYHAVNTYGGITLSYEKMDKNLIEEIASSMFSNNTYSEETFKDNLMKYFLVKYLPDSTATTRQAVVNEVFDYIERYYSFIGKQIPSTCTSTGSCTYDIKGFYINGRGNVKKEINVSDLYVRLMQCGKSSGHDYGGTYGLPLENEELIPFEKYILGVAYAEIGSSSEHAFKAQMIAARSYILARPTDMGGWRKLQQENGKWVLQVASCTADQVYCDPDKGCSTVAGGNGQWYQVHSGTGYGRKLNDPIPEDSKLRRYAADVQGETLVNNEGNIVYTTYMSEETNNFNSLAKKGYDYKQILLQVYNKKFPKGNISDINKASCGNCVANGEYSTWRQNEGEWINVKLLPSDRTISQIGCLVTSIAIQIARSGAPTNIDNFNPGTFVEYISSQGAFNGYGELVDYSIVSTAAPTFKYQSVVSLEGMNKSDKLNKIKEIVNQDGVYAVCEVKGNTGQHWVAIDSVVNDRITMMDPGTNETDMWNTYGWNNTSKIVYYKVG